MTGDIYTQLSSWFGAHEFHQIARWYDANGSDADLSLQDRIIIANAMIKLDDREAVVDVMLQSMNDAPSNPSIKQQVNKLQLARAIRRFREMRFDDCDADLKALLARDKNNIDANLELAELHLHRLEVTQAKLLIEQVLELEPKHLRASALLVVITEPTAETLNAMIATGLTSLALRDLQDAKNQFDAHFVANTHKALLSVGVSNKALPQLPSTVANPPAVQLEQIRRLTLPMVYSSQTELLERRAQFTTDLTHWCEYASPKRLRDANVTLDHLLWSNFFLAYQGMNDLPLQSQYGDWLSATVAALRPQFTQPIARAQCSPRRVGLVSSFWRDCTVGAYFGSWVKALRDAGFDVQLIQLGPLFDHRTDALAADATQFHRLNGNLDELAQAILDLRCDAIVYPEIGMDARCLILAAMRLARVQMCAWGHPVTTGLPSIDAFFSCAEMEPTGFASHYRERVVTLSGLGTRYALPNKIIQADRRPLNLPAGRLYLMPQSAFKIHPDNDAILARIAAVDGDAKIVLFNAEPEPHMRRLRARLRAAFVREGANPNRQLHYLEPVSRAAFLQVNAACDLMLDTQHWSGGNTAMDALFAGLPIVTLPGEFMRGRQSMAMLKALSLSNELRAHTSDDYVNKATTLIQTPELRAHIQSKILAHFEAFASSSEPLEQLISHLEYMLEA